MLVLKEEQIYSNFINSIRAEKTKKNYAQVLKQYMKFLQIENYSKLIGDPDKIYEQIKSYILFLRETNLFIRKHKSAFLRAQSFL